MKHFPSITKEIRNARLELCEIEAFDCIREAGCARRVKEYSKFKKARKASLEVVEQTTCGYTQHSKTTASRSNTTRR